MRSKHFSPASIQLRPGVESRTLRGVPPRSPENNSGTYIQHLCVYYIMFAFENKGKDIAGQCRIGNVMSASSNTKALAALF